MSTPKRDRDKGTDRRDQEALPGNAFEAFFHLLGRLPRWLRWIVLAAGSAAFLTFLGWSTLPEKMKERFIIQLAGDHSGKADRIDNPTQQFENDVRLVLEGMAARPFSESNYPRAANQGSAPDGGYRTTKSVGGMPCDVIDHQGLGPPMRVALVCHALSAAPYATLSEKWQAFVSVTRSLIPSDWNGRLADESTFIAEHPTCGAYVVVQNRQVKHGMVVVHMFMPTSISCPLSTIEPSR
jgi:hypothetical protein